VNADGMLRVQALQSLAMRRAIVGASARHLFCWLIAAVVVLQAFGPLALRTLPRGHFHPLSAMPAATGGFDLNAVLAHAPRIGHAHVHLEQHAHDAGTDAIDVDLGDNGKRTLDLQAPLPASAVVVAARDAPALRPAPGVRFRSRTPPPLDEPPRG
jgi:hypothetical protein